MKQPVIISVSKSGKIVTIAGKLAKDVPAVELECFLMLAHDGSIEVELRADLSDEDGR